MASEPVASVAIAARRRIDDLTSYAITLIHQHTVTEKWWGPYCPIVRIFLPLCSVDIADIGMKRADCMISLGGFGGRIATSPGPSSSLSMYVLYYLPKVV